MLFGYLQRLSICVFFSNLLFWLNCKKTLPCRAFCVEHATWDLHGGPVNKAQNAPISKTFEHTLIHLILILQQTLLFADLFCFFCWVGSPHTTTKKTLERLEPTKTIKHPGVHHHIAPLERRGASARCLT